MPILISGLGVVFAAACVWLMVRIVNRRERWAMTTLVVLLILVSYPAAYRAVLSGRGMMLMGVDETTHESFYVIYPVYRVESPAVEWFFAPAHRCDRLLRYQVWETMAPYAGQIWRNQPGLKRKPLGLYP